MDLLATVRKEGSRGGRGDFKWTDVQTSSHRENYLGHSLMAPVGRWQKGRDLNWYAKSGDDGNEQGVEDRMAQERKEELRKVKEAEQDAMARALGLPVPDRSNANMQEVSDKRDFDKALKEAVEDGTGEAGRGIGFSGRNSNTQSLHVLSERLEGNAEAQDKEMQYALREYRRRHGDRDRRDRSRSRDRERKHHKHEGLHDRRRDAAKRREREEKRHDHRHSRYRSRSRSRDREERRARRDRSRSPYRRDRDGGPHQRRR